MRTNELRLQRLLEPVVESMGYELVATELAGQGGNAVLRAFIDAPGGITLDDCAIVSRQVSAVLDVEDPISEHYTLEVSSPGIERPLVSAEHFRRVIGEQVKVETSVHYLGRRRFLGVLVAVRDGQVSVEVDGEVYDLPLADVDKARLKPDIKIA
jgi:ribosome maturation factor RimP